MLILVLLVPLFLPFILKNIWNHKICWKELALTVTASTLLTVVVYSIGVLSSAYDTEILNGQVTDKKRIHDTYKESYDCKCRTVRSGKEDRRVCKTCYRTHYTVDWNCYTTLNTISIDSRDSTSRSVYLTDDPARFTLIKPGDPVALSHNYINWIKAAPDSLFHAREVTEVMPSYPTVYDFYNINRIIGTVPNSVEWNLKLSNLLRTLGPMKQANVIIIVTPNTNPMYIEYLKSAWLGGKKNDIVLVIGSATYPKIDWVDVMSWTDSQIFKVQLRDDVKALVNIDQDAVLTLIQKHVINSYKRKEMKDFEYLKEAIEAPLWVVILSLLLGIASTVGLSYHFYKTEL